ncbi:trafficking regulator of GLUT4 1-like [Watersipora subatra]|uniref:trafficking regulator of GLUT4 1-like n=1 Tax=Watersipora subatra TaxID=2589382 RepID=UPI00355BC6EA
MADIKDDGKAETDLQQNETYNQVSQPPNYEQSEAYAAQQPLNTGQHTTPYPEQPVSSYPDQQASPHHQPAQHPEKQTGPNAPQYAQYPAGGQPPQPSYQVVHQVPVTTEYVNPYLAWSIINCLCCCWILGLIAIIMSALVSQETGRGDIEKARSYSRCAFILNVLGTVIGVILIIVIVALRLA